MDTYQIGMWGPPSSGKTTLLASIYQKAYDLGWSMKPVDTNAPDIQTFTNEVSDLVDGGVFPGNTPESTLRQYDFIMGPLNQSAWLKMIGRPTQYEVRLTDVSGEDITRGKNQQLVFNTIQESAGVLMLVDPAGSGNSFKDLFDVVNNTDDGNRIYAFCLTKMDLDDNVQYLNNPHKLLKDHVFETSYSEVKHLFDEGRAKTFATSSTGFIESSPGIRRPNIIKVVDKDGEIQTRMIERGKLWQPYKVIEPLAWLFEKVAGLRVP